MPSLPTFAASISDSLLGHSKVERDLQVQVEAQDPNVKTFVSSNGSVIPLRKKRKDPAQIDTSWSADEAYGININALLDRIENDVGDSTPTNNLQPQKDIDKDKDKKRLSSGNTLWTEKWRPHKFLDLVGNERLNRRVLFWLRQWSPLVFDEELPELTTFKKHSNPENDASDEYADPLKRPMKRILLIHGPPGIGKTSVAHVVAKQAGYSVMEINASDERAGDRVRHKVQNALFNHTFNDKPVCLIADEIDGSVENGFIKVLLDIIKSDSKATHDLITGRTGKDHHFKSSARLQKKKKNKDKLLTRPIIAVCNNVYANALEKLRPHSEIIHFQKPSENALMERLEYVCKKEKVHVSKTLLKELAVLSQGDVRNSLNNLQFMTKNGFDKDKLVTNGSDAEWTDDKRKDIGITWFKICNSIFKRDPYLDVKLQLKNLLRDVETSGNYERIIEGCFTLFPEVNYSDHGVTKPGRISDWLFFNDRMFQSLFEHNGELLRYCAFTPLEFFVMFGDIANKDELKVKTNSFEIKERERACLNLLDVINSKCSITSMIYANKQTLLMEILPMVDEILSTDLSRVRDAQIRQRSLDLVIPLFHDFQLQIQQSSNPDTRNALVVDPPLDQIVLLDGKKLREVITKRSIALKFSLAKLEEEKIRKRALDRVMRDKETNENNRKRQKMEGTGSRSVDFFKDQYNSIKTTAENASLVAPPTKNTRSAFSFTRESTPTTADEAAKAALNAEEMRIWVKYKEGFSNAVRKNISWSQLWE